MNQSVFEQTDAQEFLKSNFSYEGSFMNHAFQLSATDWLVRISNKIFDFYNYVVHVKIHFETIYVF